MADGAFVYNEMRQVCCEEVAMLAIDYGATKNVSISNYSSEY